MSFRRRALFLAGLLVAVSCSDAGNPLTPEGPEQPEAGGTPEHVLQAVSCVADVIAKTISCTPMGPGTGGGLGAINVGGGDTAGTGNAYAEFIKTNDLSTADSAIFDMAIKNNMNGQAMGTADGMTADSIGMRVFFYKAQAPSIEQPQVLTKINPAQAAWVKVVTPDSQVFKGAGSKKRPFFQYDPQILDPGEVSSPETWKFDLENVATWKFIAYIYTEVPNPLGWLDLTPPSDTVAVGDSVILAAHVRKALGTVRAPIPMIPWPT
jgi:hypothetical protein